LLAVIPVFTAELSLSAISCAVSLPSEWLMSHAQTAWHTRRVRDVVSTIRTDLDPLFQSDVTLLPNIDSIPWRLLPNIMILFFVQSKWKRENQDSWLQVTRVIHFDGKSISKTPCFSIPSWRLSLFGDLLVKHFYGFSVHFCCRLLWKLNDRLSVLFNKYTSLYGMTERSRTLTVERVSRGVNGGSEKGGWNHWMTSRWDITRDDESSWERLTFCSFRESDSCLRDVTDLLSLLLPPSFFTCLLMPLLHVSVVTDTLTLM
jgi:hypothetical protein